MNELIKSDYKKKLLKKFKIKVPYGNNIIPNDYNMQQRQGKIPLESAVLWLYEKQHSCNSVFTKRDMINS